jgi:hypothetical protein
MYTCTSWQIGTSGTSSSMRSRSHASRRRIRCSGSSVFAASSSMRSYAALAKPRSLLPSVERHRSRNVVGSP